MSNNIIYTRSRIREKFEFDPTHAMDGRTHYIHNVTHTMLVSGGTLNVMRRCTVGYRINQITEEGAIVTVADAVCNKNLRHSDDQKCEDRREGYSRARGRDIVDSRLNMDAEAHSQRRAGRNLRRYTFLVPQVVSLPENSAQWRALDSAVKMAVCIHNNGYEDRNIARFIEGSRLASADASTAAEETVAV